MSIQPRKPTAIQRISSEFSRILEETPARLDREGHLERILSEVSFTLGNLKGDNINPSDPTIEIVEPKEKDLKERAPEEVGFEFLNTVAEASILTKLGLIDNRTEETVAAFNRVMESTPDLKTILPIILGGLENAYLSGDTKTINQFVHLIPNNEGGEFKDLNEFATTLGKLIISANQINPVPIQHNLSVMFNESGKILLSPSLFHRDRKIRALSLGPWLISTILVSSYLIPPASTIEIIASGMGSLVVLASGGILINVETRKIKGQEKELRDALSISMLRHRCSNPTTHKYGITRNTQST